MKKIIMAFLVVFLSAGCVNLLHAQQQTPDEQQQGTKYYYYPSSNVYQNTSTNEYWYYDDANTKWVSVQELPSTVTLVKEPVYTVYYKGTDIWKDNSTHIKKYKVSKNGKVKEKG